MIRAHTVPVVRAAEDRVRARLPEGTLMDRAARAVAAVVADRAAGHGSRVVVLAGPGDNGGDALYAAAYLADPAGATPLPADGGITVVAAADLHPGGAAAARRAGVPILDARVGGGPDTLPEDVVHVLGRAGVVLDGLLGIGGRPGLSPLMDALVRSVPDRAHVIALDLPSGADPAGRELPDAAVRADETVAIGMAKPVHLSPVTAPAVGTLTVVDIGVDMAREGPGGGPAEVALERFEDRDVADRWPVPGRADHKYSRGVVTVVAGSRAYPGAAVLVVAAAIGAGAGMVRLVAPARVEDLVLARFPEVVPGTGRTDAVVVGPGIDPEEIDLAPWWGVEQPLLVDAGALDPYVEHVATHGPRQRPTLLTPHAGEAARALAVLPRVPEGLTDPLDVARALAGGTGAAVLLKGSTTVVVEPDRAAVPRTQAEAPAWLATAGAGDVLAGLTGALLAAGRTPGEAGAMAALVHGRAADRANPGGPVRALRVAAQMPQVVSGLIRLRSDLGRDRLKKQ